MSFSGSIVNPVKHVEHAEVQVEFDLAERVDVQSLYVEADEIRVETRGVDALMDDTSAGACMGPFVDYGMGKERAGRYEGLCPGASVTAKAVNPRFEAFTVQFTAMGIRTLEWHNAALGCAGSGACPSSGTRAQEPHSTPGGNFTLRDLSFQRLSTVDGTLALEGAAMWAMYGASALDLTVDGSGRFPDGTTECEACGGGQTLQLEGNFTLAGLTLQPDGTMAARLEGTVTGARLDESPVDPAAVLGLGAAATAAAVGLVVLAKALLGVLFTKMRRDKDLANGNRRRVHDYIQDHPGTTLREIARRTDLAMGVVRFHIRVLTTSGRITEQRHGKSRRFFLANNDAASQRLQTILLREPALHRLHDLLSRQPWLGQSDIIDVAHLEAGWTRSTTQHRLGRLVEAGLAESLVMGRRKLYAAIEPVGAAPPLLERTHAAGRAVLT